jgi:peptidoglycan/LPS O-acetylase OafA/YrhL
MLTTNQVTAILSLHERTAPNILIRDEIPESLPEENSDNPGGYNHIPALDGIRGTAILLVLFYHLFWSNPHSGSRIFDFINELRGFAWIGVNLFFALSGFLITGILRDTLHSDHFFKTFYARRILRIFPLYYGVLLLILVLTRPLQTEWNGWQYFYLTYTSNLALWRTQPFITPHVNINHFWSLQVEEQFYLIWPFMVYKIRSIPILLRVCLSTCVVVFLIRTILVVMQSHFNNISLLRYPTFSCVDNLLFGCGLALLLRTPSRQQVLNKAPVVFATCVAIIAASGLIRRSLDWQTSVFIPTLGFSIIGIACASCIAMALRVGSRTQSLFDNRALRFFGKYSYGIYVFHYSLDLYLTVPIRIFIVRHFHSRALSVITSASLVLVLSVLVALLSYHLYEVHFLKLKKYFSYTRPATALTASL